MNLGRVFLAAIWSAVAFPSSLSASLIATASASWSGFVCPVGPYGDCQVPRIPVGDSPTTTGTNVSAHVSPPSPGVGGATGTAIVDYGHVSVSAGANTGLAAFTSLQIFLMQASASASFDDSITIFGGVGTGMVEAVGYFYCCQAFEGVASASFHLGTAGSGVGLFRGLHLTPFDILTPFTFGAPLNISGSASAEAQDSSPFDASSGSADAAAEVFLSKLIVLNGTGQPVAGYSYSSASGSSYVLQDGVLVPEPGNRVMVIIALGLIFALVRSKS